MNFRSDFAAEERYFDNTCLLFTLFGDNTLMCMRSFFHSRHLSALVAASVLVTLGACTKKDDTTTTTTNETTTSQPATPASPEPTASPAGGMASTTTTTTSTNKAAEVTLTIATQGDENAFDKKELVAKAGSTVKVTFTNSGKSSNMSHNWVLVKPGSTDAVATAGTQAGEEVGYVPASDPNVLAHTKLVPMGQSDSVTFTAPSTPGDYPFLCTYPGHSVTMRGTLKVN